MGNSELVNHYLQLVREDERAEATEFVYSFEWVQTSHSILDANYRELRAIPDRFNHDRHLLHEANQGQKEALHTEFIQRLHNYLASVKTLVDHTRTFRSRHVRDEVFDKQWDDRLKQLREDPVVTFLQEFRNPVLHSHLPRVALTTTFPEGKCIRRQLTIGVAELLRMHDWSVEERRYIETAKEGYYEDKKYIDVTTAATRYQAVVTAFYSWFYELVGVVKGPLFAEFMARRTELALLQKTMHRDESG